MSKFTSLITTAAPREIWPDAEPGHYVLHDPIGSAQMVELLRSRDTLLVRFPGCDEEFRAEDLNAVFEGPLSESQVNRACELLGPA